jgi:dipeptidase
VMTLVAPTLTAAMGLSPDTDPKATNYPFSVKPDKPLSPADLMRIQRDHYEGSEFDLTKGLAAGPYGDPNRFDWTAVDNMTTMEVFQGSFERAISLFRTSYSIVAVPRESVPDQLSLVWICQYAPSSSSYIPLYVSMAAMPGPYTR